MSEIIELFCGASGFGLGAELAGFKLVASADVDEILTSSHRVNFPNCELILTDLGKASSRSLLPEELAGKRLTGIIGGPPCQGFSSMGKRDANDPRNDLLNAFFRHVAKLRPKFFVMENVPGLIQDDHQARIQNALSLVSSYYEIIGPVILDAADFGAATRRKRVLIIGYDPKCFDQLTVDDFQEVAFKSTNVKQAMADLPQPCFELETEDGYNWVRYPRQPGRLSNYAAWARATPPKRLSTEKVRRMHSDGYVTGVNPTKHTAEVEARWLKLAPGTTDKISKAPKLAWDGLCTTLRAGTGKEKGGFQALRPIHPDKARMITVREAARLQGFPDWFQFHPTIWHSFRMIGNSVSPVFAREVLSVIKLKLCLSEGENLPANNSPHRKASVNTGKWR